MGLLKHYFLDHLIEAPLKVRKALAAFFSPQAFPRSSDRGPIEGGHGSFAFSQLLPISSII